MCRGHVHYPALAPGSQQWLFAPFVSFVQNLCQLPMHTVIFSPVQLVSLCLVAGELCQMPALQHGR